MTPAVSIILPTYNRPQFIADAVRSVGAQSFDDWELLIADDGSEATTRACLEALQAPPRIRVLALAHSGNPPAVRNRALRQTEGRFVAFIDSDDIWQPTKLAKQMALLQADATRPWCYTGARLVDEQLQPRSPSELPSGASGWIADSLLRLDTVLAQSSVVVRRDVLERCGAYDERLPVSGDFELWVRLAAQYEVHCVDEPLVLVRRHRAHYSDDVTACADFARALKLLRAHLPTPQLRALLRRRRAIAAVTLARSQVRAARHRAALATVLASAPYSLDVRSWWRGAAAACAEAAVPQRVLDRLRARR